MNSEWRKVNKRTARKLYDADTELVIVASKLWPFGGWQPAMHVRQSERTAAYGEPISFDDLVNQYEGYNCTHETGYHAAYYVKAAP